MRSIKIRALALLLAVGLSATVLYAQTNTLSYEKFGTNAVGHMASVYNVIDSTIADGTICVFDTSTAGVKRWGVRPYAGTALTKVRIAGVAVGNITRSSLGGAGKVLTLGYHPNAKMAASGLTANTLIKVAYIHGSFTTIADSLPCQVGVFIGYNSRSTAANSRGKILITKDLSTWCGTLQ